MIIVTVVIVLGIPIMIIRSILITTITVIATVIVRVMPIMRLTMITVDHKKQVSTYYTLCNNTTLGSCRNHTGYVFSI